MNAIPVLNLNNVLVEEGVTESSGKTFYKLASNIVEVNGQRFRLYVGKDMTAKLYPIVEAPVVNKTAELKKLAGESIGKTTAAPKVFSTVGKKKPTVNPVLAKLAEKMGLDEETAAAAFPHLAK